MVKYRLMELRAIFWRRLARLMLRLYSKFDQRHAELQVRLSFEMTPERREKITREIRELFSKLDKDDAPTSYWN